MPDSAAATASPRRALVGQSLRHRLGVFTSIVSVVLVMLLVTAGFLLVRVHDNQRQVTTQMFAAVRAAGDSRAAAVDQETGVRGFLLAGNRTYLQPYTEGIAREAAADKAVRAALSGRTELLGLYEDAVAAQLDWRSGYAEPIVAASEGAAVQLAASRQQAGKELFDAYRARFAAFDSALIDARDRLQDSLNRSLVALAAMLGAASLGVLLAGIALAVSLRRWVLLPLSVLAGQTRAVSDGAYTRTVTSDGPTEIDELASDVETMRARIVLDLEALASSRAGLEEARTQLEEQAAELKRSNTELEQFAYVASHDLQEPLRKVASFSQMLQKRYGGQLDERADQYIEFAVDGAKRMQVLINDLLAFSRVGRSGRELAEIPLEHCLDAALRSLNVPVDAQVTREPMPVVHGDPTLLTQVFQNLIGNSLKFRGADPPRVHVGAERADEEWQLTVSDNGIGVETQFADKIFVIFQRLHPREEYDGTGIGLAMCRKIVEFHGGRLWLVEDDEPGSKFRFTLPVLEPVPAEPDPAPAPIPELAPEVRTSSLLALGEQREDIA